MFLSLAVAGSHSTHHLFFSSISETGITVWNHWPPSEGWRGGDSWTNDGATSPWVRLPGHGNPHIANAFPGIKCQINTAPQLLPCECVSSPAGSRCHVLFTWCGGQKLYLSAVFQIPRSNPGQQGHCNIWISLRVLIGTWPPKTHLVQPNAAGNSEAWVAGAQIAFPWSQKGLRVWSFVSWSTLCVGKAIL